MALSVPSSADPSATPVTVDLSHIAPAIPIRKTLMVVNQFIVNTSHFLNKFSILCEGKLAKVGKDLNRLEIVLALLETKINSIPWLQANLSAASVSSSAASVDNSAASGPPVGASGGPPVGVSAGPPVGVSAGPPVGVSAGPPVGAAAGPPNSVVAAAPAAASNESGVPIKDDPRYKKYFVMQRVGVSVTQIKLKMEQDGVDSSVIDRDPMSPSDYIPPANEEESSSEED